MKKSVSVAVDLLVYRGLLRGNLRLLQMNIELQGVVLNHLKGLFDNFKNTEVVLVQFESLLLYLSEVKQVVCQTAHKLQFGQTGLQVISHLVEHPGTTIVILVKEVQGLLEVIHSLLKPFTEQKCGMDLVSSRV